MLAVKKQIITCKFGNRKLNGETKFHYGVDLRSVDKTTWKKLKVVLPEKCKIIRVGYQEEWGYNLVAETMDGYILKYIHIVNPEDYIVVGEIYPAGQLLGFTTVTPYMTQKKYYEHLHFEVWKDDEAINPEDYFKERGCDYE